MTLAPPVAAGEVRLQVGGQVREQDGRLVVRVDLTNEGDAAARGMQVEGELLDARSEAALADPLRPGATAPVELSFPGAVPRLGVHGLGLHLRYWPDGAPAGAEATSQRAYLLLALGANPAPSVRLTVPEARVARHGVVPVRLESADGEAHAVTLRALAPRGVNAREPEGPVRVPAVGSVTAPLRVLRAGAPPGTRAGLVVMATEVEGPLARTAVATGLVEIAPARPWLPRLRVPLVAAALALIAGAVGLELRAWARRA